MGLFVSQVPNPVPIASGLTNAYLTDGLTEELAMPRATAESGPLAAAASSGEKVYHFDRILVAFVLFFILLAVAILCDAKDWVDDPKVLYGMATTVLGIIVGFLGGEASAGPSN